MSKLAHGVLSFRIPHQLLNGTLSRAMSSRYFQVMIRSLFFVVLIAVSHAQKETCDNPNEGSCSSEVPLQFENVFSLPFPPDLFAAAGRYCTFMSIIDILHELLLPDHSIIESEHTIKGFNFSLGERDNTVIIAPTDEVALNDILAEFSTGGLEDFVHNVATHLQTAHLSVTNISFVAWQTMEEGQGLTSIADSYSIVLPLDVAETTVLKVSNSTTRSQFKLDTGALIVTRDVVIQTTVMDEVDFGVILSLEPSAKEMKFPRTDVPIEYDINIDPLLPGQIQPVTWARSGVIPTVGAFRMGLDPKVGIALREHVTKIGMVETLHHLLYEEPLPMKNANKLFTFGDFEWYIERPGEFMRFDMLFLVPKDEAAHDDFLKAMSAAGFDAVIDAVARNFGWDSAVCTHISLLALTNGIGGERHADFYDTGGKAFNVLLPLILVEGSEPELYIDSDDLLRAEVKYQENEAVLVGDNGEHATRPIDYRETGKFRFFAGIYIADINEENYDMATPSYYVGGYPHHDTKTSLKNAGKHWRRNDGSYKLPTW